MLKELWESFKRQWEEWKVLRWWTRKRAAHYVQEEDETLFQNIAGIMHLATVEIKAIDVYQGVEKIRLFGRTEVCDYLVRICGVNIMVDVNLLPFWDELRLLNESLWTSMPTSEMTAVPYPICNAQPLSQRCINVVWHGTYLTLIIGDTRENITIDHCIQLMMKYFLNLSVNYAARVAETPLTNVVYASCSDLATIQDRTREIQTEWDKSCPTLPPPEPSPDQQAPEQDEEEKNPEPPKEETDEQPEVN